MRGRSSSKSRRAYIVVCNDNPAGRALHHIPLWLCVPAAARPSASSSSPPWADWLLSIGPDGLFAMCNYPPPPATTYATVQFSLLQTETRPAVPCNRPRASEAPKAGSVFPPFFSFMSSSQLVRQHAERTGRLAFASFDVRTRL